MMKRTAVPLFLAALMAPTAAFLLPQPRKCTSTQLFGEIFKGTVKWFDDTKGFGFITRDNDGEEFFVHQTGIQADGFRALEDGSAVEFQVGTADNGKTKAEKVTGPDGKQVPRGYAYKKREE
ncbi:Probable cold shock protein A [Seminavis robusta]|uniref:Probable cold shock protein A n=1 Tax=Seminavis robusta TaxID=568900 RepID=A0A9N8DB60_9STRA|nr:Probable cold shock protein A [Seminavis robusta]|eukprot:Sro42_g025490.1 Probable cold shock protein A (122) ;mRNA; f:35822-36187